MNPTHCKFFNGTTHNTTCKAGVAFSSVTPYPKRILGLELRRPCRAQPFGYPNSSPAQIEEHAKRGTCAKFELPSAAEVEQDEQEWKIYSRQCTEARAAVIEHAKGNSIGQGSFSCPICKAAGVLRYRIAACNGHVRAQCSTVGCVNWME